MIFIRIRKIVELSKNCTECITQFYKKESHLQNFSWHKKRLVASLTNISAFDDSIKNTVWDPNTE